MGIIEENIDTCLENDGKSYEPEEDAFILREYGKSSTNEIAEALGRSVSAVISRASRLKAGKKDIPEGHKYCKRCDTIKSMDEFFSKKGTKDGKYSMCKSCSAKAKAKKRQEDKIRAALEKNNMIKEQEAINEAIKEKNYKTFVCRFCKEEKPGEDFLLYKNLKVNTICKKCRLEIDERNAVKRIKDGVDW